MARAPIPAALARDVLTEAGYRCALPTCRQILAIDLHHILEVREGGGNELHNLIALCPTVAVRSEAAPKNFRDGRVDRLVRPVPRLLQARGDRTVVTTVGDLGPGRNLVEHLPLTKNGFGHLAKQLIRRSDLTHRPANKRRSPDGVEVDVGR
jgi:hypothetical protein